MLAISADHGFTYAWGHCLLTLWDGSYYPRTQVLPTKSFYLNLPPCHPFFFFFNGNHFRILQNLGDRKSGDPTPSVFGRKDWYTDPPSLTHLSRSWTLFSNNYIFLDLFPLFSPRNPPSIIITFWSIQIISLLCNFFGLSPFHLCCLKYNNLKPLL